MEKDVTVSARMPLMLARDLDELADAYQRSRSQLVLQAVSRYVEYEQQFRAAVQEGLADIEAGRVVAHDEMLKKFNIRRKKNKRC